MAILGRTRGRVYDRARPAITRANDQLMASCKRPPLGGFCFGLQAYAHLEADTYSTALDYISALGEGFSRVSVKSIVGGGGGSEVVFIVEVSN